MNRRRDNNIMGIGKWLMLVVSIICIGGSLMAQDKRIFTPKYIKKTMAAATDWQMDNLYTTTVLSDGGIEPVPATGWIRGVFYTGVMATYRVTKEQKYLDLATEWGRKNEWKFGERKKHADDQIVGQTYADLYIIKKEAVMIKEMQEVFDGMLATPEPGLIVGWSKNKNWKWCDALYMAPPVMAKMSKITDDPKYLYLMNTMWWECYHHLYDKSEGLFFRDDRYVWSQGKENRKTKNGRKVFWGRGNGWVLAGLAKVISWLPEDYTTRGAYEDVFKEMSASIARLQAEDGLWRASLLDIEDYPSHETSSSAFFCFGLAWGINQGLLDRDTFLPVVNKAWTGLNKYMSKDGKLGFVQQVGHDPRNVSADDSMEYGTAAYLLAAEQMLKLIE